MNRTKFAIAGLLLCSSLAEGAVPSSFAFGSGNSWVVLYEDGNRWGYRGDQVPVGVANAIEDMKSSQVILGVAMNDTSWMVIGSKTWTRHNLPTSLEEQISQDHETGWQVIDAALTQSGSWVLLTRKNGTYRWRSSGGDVPQELVDYLEQVTDRNYRVLGVGITSGGGWAACYQSSNSVGYRLRMVPAEAADYVDELEGM